MKHLEKRMERYYFPVSVVSISCVIIAYIFKFHGNNISSNPEQWGQIGDYFGGLLNPIISFTTLIFLIKAYYSQRQELEDTKIALKDTVEYNRKQTAMMNTSIKISKFNVHIDLCHKEIGYIQDEINRAEECKYKQKGNIGYNFYSRDGSEISPRDLNKYISDLVITMHKETMKLKETMDKVNSLTEDL
ncbi:hypothetical protein NUK32_05245 [Aeromonas caviae]|uniref:hypothetical protein n=1 Tax=Aeromonas caviae TaxID=648 RepID=UPI00214D72BE|nr:hypothetical protein [Aeromonas caviae]MCR3946354.1 hypothetical protein [Aeromonas caviae]